MSNVSLNYAQIIDPVSFKSVNLAKIYIGESGTLPNPAVPATWKQAYFVNSDGTRTAASQPIRTNASGFAVDGSGNIKTVQVDGGYSLLVQDQYGATKFSQASSAVNDGTVLEFDLISSFSGAPDGAIIFFKGKDSVGDGGGGIFYYAASSTAVADGGIVVAPSSGGRLLRDGWSSSGYSGEVNPLYWGADRTGAASATSSIQSAINAAIVYKKSVTVSPGTYKITAPLTFSGRLSIVAQDWGNVFTNQAAQASVVFNCNTVSGYLFTQPAVSDGTGSISISGISFSGLNGSTRSTTWQGLIDTTGTLGLNAFFATLNNVFVGGSNSATPILSYKGEVFAEANQCFFGDWPLGIGVQSGNGSNLATTITFNKCYWNSLRQVYEFYNNVSDVTFNDCVMESCMVVGAALKTNVYLNNCYSENIGYDPSGTGITTGITPRSFGISDSPAITGNVVAAHTCRYGQIVFNGYTPMSIASGKYWVEGIGRDSTMDSAGQIVLSEVSAFNGTINLFRPDPDSARGQFVYKVSNSLSKKRVLTHADARLVTDGKFGILFSDGNARFVSVSSGQITVPASSSLGFSAVPTAYPDGGQWNVGDIVYKAPSSQAAGTELSWSRTTAGTTSDKWDTDRFTGLSVSASVANGGTMQIPVTLVEIGTIYEYDVLASTSSGTATACGLKIVIGHYASGSGMSVQTLSGSGISASYSHGNPVTITNSTGSTVSIYAKLISVGRTHA